MKILSNVKTSQELLVHFLFFYPDIEINEDEMKVRIGFLKLIQKLLCPSNNNLGFANMSMDFKIMDEALPLRQYIIRRILYVT